MAEKPVSTQHYLNIADIKDNILVLRNGELRQVIEVIALNFALKSEQEQSAIVYQYQAFLNSLQFPMQLLVQSRRLDLTRYLGSLEERINQAPSPLIKAQITDYLDFVSRLISLGNIMEKHFYVVVPYTHPGIRSRNLLGQFFRREIVHVNEKDLADAKEKLADRVELIRSSLATMGLTATVLSGEQVVKLLYSSYNPTEAGEIAMQPPVATEQR